MKFYSLRLTCIILFISILTTIFLLAGNTKAIAQDECSLIWQAIMSKMIEFGFSFERRVFSIDTSKSPDEISLEVRRVFDEIKQEYNDIYLYITDCYFLNLNNLKDLPLPENNSHFEVQYNLLKKKNLSAA